MNRLRANLAASIIALGASSAALAATGAEAIPDSYAKPATRIQLDGGRVLNLRCSGEGERAVLFEAGANADSSTWYRVLPLLEGQARVCAYDRAGYGFSDEGPMPRDVDAGITDLHAVIHAAGLRLPLVLVGHSLGSNIVRGYAQRFPGDVAGMVLVDPPEQGAQAQMPDRWKQDDATLRQKRDALLSACEKAADAGTFLASPVPGCLRSPPPWMGEEVAASVQANKAKPGYWRTLRSELTENQRTFATPVSTKERHGGIPLILLRAGEPPAGMPEDVAAVLTRARAQTHQRIMATSTRSTMRDVPGTSHDIQLDRPEAVAAAVVEMLRTPKPNQAQAP